MEDDLYSTLGPVNEAPNLMTELAPPTTPDKTPLASIRNRAAAIALLSKGDPVENYQAAVQRVRDNSIETTRLWGDIENGVRTDTLQGTMAILASKEYSFEEKQRLIASKNTDAPQISLSKRLMEKGLADASGNETPAQEQVRINTLDILDNMARDRAEIQGIINAHASGLDSNMSKGFFDMLASDFLPFGNNVIQARIAKSRGESPWGVIKALLLPGSDAAKMQDAYFEIPSSEGVKLAKKYVEIVSGSAGVLYGDDNHYAQYSKLSKMLSGEESSTPETVLENLAPLLDIFGLRAEYKAGKLLLQARRLAKETKAAESLSKARVDPLKPVAPTGPVQTPVGLSKAPDESLLSTVRSSPDQAAAAARKEISLLEAEKASLLEGQNLANRGDIRNLQSELASLRKPDTDAKTLADSIKKANPRMSSKEARVEAQKRIDDELADYNARADRITSQIESNKTSEAITQKISELEKKIQGMSKGVPENAGSLRTILADDISRIEWNNTIRYDNPSAVANVIGSVNPAKARSLFASVVTSSSDEVAQALYGSSKVDALAANTFPQAIPETGAVMTKVPGIQDDLFDNEVLKTALKDEGLDFTKDELASADRVIRKKFEDVSGLSVNDAMGGIILDREGGIAKVSAVYGTSEGGFGTAKEALSQARFALRDLGVKAEDVEILAKDGISHRPVDVDAAGDIPGEYYVRVKMPYRTKVEDVGSLEWEDVHWNGADNLPILMGNEYTGSLTRNLVDIASMFSKRFSSAAVRASDVAAGLDKMMIDEVKIFTDKFDKLSSARKKKLQDYLKESNARQIKDDVNDLVARGFNQEEMDTIKSFRDFWDTHYHLENLDFTRTLNNEGWKVLDHPTDKFIAKELPPNMWREVREFLDPRTGNIEFFDEAMRININNSKGQLAVLRRPVTINGQEVKHIFVDNNPTSYLRTVRDTDQVLNKLDGYYTTVYKAPRFVDKVTYDVKGNVVSRKAVAVAGDWETAENFAKRQNPGANEKFVTRSDDRSMPTGSDDWFDINSAQGRISQRHRGAPLEGSGGSPAILGSEGFVLSPTDSAVRAARSIAGRISARPMLENSKARFVQQYKEWLRPDEFGQYSFPNSLADIGQKGIHSGKELADARSTWEMIRYLENGYLNAADQMTKQFFNGVSLMLGKKGLSKAERAVGAIAEGAPASAVKSATFNLTVASNIVRQWVIQPAQIMRLPAYDPIGFAQGRWFKHMGEFFASVVSGKSNAFSDFVRDSNLMSTVDKQNLIRGSIENAMDHSSRITRAVNAPISAARTIGFDTAERANLLGHLAAVYGKYQRKGMNLSDARVRAEAFAEVRHMTGNMNYAGDFPYNQTAASIATQFMQAPHKMLLQYTNRALDKGTRARLLAWDLFFWGVPGVVVANQLFEKVVPDVAARKAISEGAASQVLNKVLKDAFDTDKEIDIASLAPNDVSGFAHVYEAIVTGGASEIMSNAPAGSLFGSEGRVQGAVRMMGRYWRGFTDPEASDVEMKHVAVEVAKILPLVNNAYKAALILKEGERRNSLGGTVETDVPSLYAAFQIAGFGSKNMADYYKESKKLTEYSKEQEDNLYTVYKEVRKIYASIEEKDFNNMEHFTRVTGALLAPYKDVPWAQKKMTSWIQRDMVGPDLAIHLKLMRMSGIPDDGTVRRSIENLPNIKPEDKQQYYRIYQDFNNTGTKEE
jgi:hypothetical protein